MKSILALLGLVIIGGVVYYKNPDLLSPQTSQKPSQTTEPVTNQKTMDTSKLISDDSLKAVLKEPYVYIGIVRGEAIEVGLAGTRSQNITAETTILKSIYAGRDVSASKPLSSFQSLVISRYSPSTNPDTLMKRGNTYLVIVLAHLDPEMKSKLSSGTRGSVLVNNMEDEIPSIIEIKEADSDAISDSLSQRINLIGR